MTAPLPYLLITLHATESVKSLLVIKKILRLVVNTLTTDEKYSLLNRKNLTQSIHIQFSQKEKTFPEFFLHF